jgi:DNA-binding response OmpR family regulator
MRILLVEDDEDLAQALREALEDELYAVDLAASGNVAEELAAVNDYDLAVLDWSIPPPNGMELLAGWRRAGRDLPVLMLTGRGGVEDRVSGLDGGADDYMAKPFDLQELLARVRSLLRRRDRPIPPIEIGDVSFDRAARQVKIGGESVRLTPKEFGILEYLMSRSDEAVSRAELAEHVWDRNFDPMSNTLDVLVYRVRKKIDGNRPDRLLHTVAGVGYMLTSERRQLESSSS